MLMRRSPSVLFLVGMGVVATACNWTTFASDAEKAPARSIKAPSGYTSTDFGVSLLPLSDGQGQAAAFVASSLDGAELVVMKIDSGGGVSSTSVAASNLTGTRDSAITSLTEVPGTAPSVELLLGTPNLSDNTNAGQIYSLVLPDGMANAKLVPAVGSVEVGWGRGLATGHLTGATTTDFIVSSDRQLAVLVGATFDAAANAAITMTAGAVGCDVTFDWAGLDNRYRLRRPLLTARLWAGGVEQQLVVGSTHSAAPGVVSFLSVDATASRLTCITTATQPKSHFGQSLATGDFNADGNPDLLVGAPTQGAFVYLGPFQAGSLPTPIAIMDSTGVDFGYAVAALNIDPTPGDEVLIGDPRATVDGVANAGRVVAYKFDASTMTMKEYKTFADHSPESGSSFGSTVDVLKFCTAASISPTTACPDASTAHVLMVGAGNEVFVYFQVGDNIPLRTRDGMMVHDVRGP